MPVRPHCQPDTDGRDRSLSQKKPGWNNLLLPMDEQPSQLVPELAPQGDEIVVTKTTDSALTGTNLRLILHNLGIKHVVCAGIFTDQCISSTVRSLADESFDVVVVEDCCAAGSDELHRKGTRDHQHDLLPCGLEFGTYRHDGLGKIALWFIVLRNRVRQETTGRGRGHMAQKSNTSTIDVSNIKTVDLLHSKAVGLIGVLFLTVTGAAPISAMLGNVPFAAGYGIGIHTPAAFLLATIVLTIFSVGYATMAGRVSTVWGVLLLHKSGAWPRDRHVGGFLIARMLFDLRGLADRAVRVLRQCLAHQSSRHQCAMVASCAHNDRTDRGARLSGRETVGPTPRHRPHT